MSALKEVLREYIDDGGSEEVHKQAAAELASMRRLIEAVEKWKKIVSNYYINTREDSSLLSAIDKYKEQK